MLTFLAILAVCVVALLAAQAADIECLKHGGTPRLTRKAAHSGAQAKAAHAEAHSKPASVGPALQGLY